MNLTEADAETLLYVIERTCSAILADKDYCDPDYGGQSLYYARKDAMKLLTAPEEE
jgi:hypothetical protein